MKANKNERKTLQALAINRTRRLQNEEETEKKGEKKNCTNIDFYL